MKKLQVKVLVPFSNQTATYTVNDIADLEPKEAEDLDAAGIVTIIGESKAEAAKPGKTGEIETTEAPRDGAEEAVIKRGKKKE